MSDAAIFVGFFGGIFVVRIIAATVVFCWLLPRGDRCPNCDAPTLWIQSPTWNRLFPWLRTSWCADCGWDGMLRHGPLTPPGPVAEHALPTPRPRRRRTSSG
jgi:hypothetical protein